MNRLLGFGFCALASVSLADKPLGQYASGGAGGFGGGGFGGSAFGTGGGFGDDAQYAGGAGGEGDNLEEVIPGIPGDDYPIFAEVPETSFFCDGQTDGGYYSDPEAECQAFHICAGDGTGGLTKYSFLCPNGTLFNQQYFVCDWWFNVDCAATEQFYSLNDELDTARQSSSLSGQGEYDSEAQTNSQTTNFKRSRVGRGSGLRRSLSQLVQEAERENLVPDIDNSLTSVTSLPDSPQSRPAISLQSLYGPPGGSNSRLGNNLEEILRFEAEIPPEYKRPSRDLQFDYVNTATARMEATKAVREAEDEANKLLETLVRLVSPDDIDQLYIR